MPHKIIRLPEVLRRTGLSRSSIYSGISAGTFVPQIQLAARAVGWDADAIDQWLAERIASASASSKRKNK